VYSVLNGIVAEQTDGAPLQAAKAQIARIALRSAAPVNGGFGPERVRRVVSAASSAGGVEGGTHMLRIRWLLAMAADIAHRPPARQSSFASK
jgi:hypothetical protein